MPRLVDVELPPWATAAYDVLGHRPGLAVLAVLAAHAEPVGHGDVAQASGLNSQAASVALQRLEDAGVVSRSLPRGQRPGRQGVTWALDRDALARVLHELADGLAVSR